MNFTSLVPLFGCILESLMSSGFLKFGFQAAFTSCKDCTISRIEKHYDQGVEMALKFPVLTALAS